MQDVKKRIAELEQRFKANQPIDFEDFREMWQKLTPFDRAAFEADALGENEPTRTYLIRMGVIDKNEKTLREIAAELDGGCYENCP